MRKMILWNKELQLWLGEGYNYKFIIGRDSEVLGSLKIRTSKRIEEGVQMVLVSPAVDRV